MGRQPPLSARVLLCIYSPGSEKSGLWGVLTFLGRMDLCCRLPRMAVRFVRALLCIRSGFVIVLLSLLLPIFAFASEPVETLVAVRANGRIVSDYESALKDDAHWYQI